MGYKHFKFYDRIRLESWLRSKTSISFIAKELNKSRASIYREIKRGQYVHTLSDLTEELRYSAELAESKYQEHLKSKGPGLKISNDYSYAAYIEYMIVKRKYSPEAALNHIKNNNITFSTTLSKTTIYRYINDNIFLALTNKDLPIKRNKSKQKYKKVRPCRVMKGKSIEQRPDILKRDAFGHWEMDCVVGKKKTRSVLLVLTERLSRKELIFKMPGKNKENVVNVLNDLELRCGDNFKRIFKTITCDNGVEFADSYGIEHSVNGEKRVDLYYCHPYSSCERGSNENQNKMIRRHFPKGFNFTKTTRTEIARVENWINSYPRKMFHGYSSNDIFDLCLRTVGI